MSENVPELYDEQAELDGAYCDVCGFAHEGGQCQ